MFYDGLIKYLVEMLLRRSGQYNPISISVAAWRGIVDIRTAVPIQHISMV